MKENYAKVDCKTPYKQNFENFGYNMLTKDFKESMMKTLGAGVRCLTSNDPLKQIATFMVTSDLNQLPSALNNKLNNDRR